MQSNPHEVLWLDGSQRVSLDDLAGLSCLSAGEIRELVDAGVLAPLDQREVPWTFSTRCVVTVRKARRLRDELELEGHALALALVLLERIEALEAELSRLRAQAA